MELKHTSQNLIPSLEKSGNKILALVSRTPKINNRRYKTIKTIDKAIKILPKKTIYIISTPPKTHYKIFEKLAKFKSTIFIEKPIFVNLKEVFKAKNLALRKNISLIENHMYKFTDLYTKFNKVFLSKFNDINFINLTFTIPSIPIDTFRDSKDLENSCLYDIGCYIVDLFTSHGLSLDKIKIQNLEVKKNRIIKLQFTFYINHIFCDATIGIENNYNNFVELKTKNNKFKFFNFFYGRISEKNIISNEKTIKFNDKNAFINMFNYKYKINKIYILKRSLSYKKNTYYLDCLKNLTICSI